MAKIIKQRERKEEVTYRLCFEKNDMPGAGYSFDCDEHGNVDTSKMQPAALENYNGCISGEYNVRAEGVQPHTNRWTDPAVLKCDCGTHVSLGGFTNTCAKCEADYNSSGQRLAPRSQWGEETGEHWSDCY